MTPRAHGSFVKVDITHRDPQHPESSISKWKATTVHRGVDSDFLGQEFDSRGLGLPLDEGVWRCFARVVRRALLVFTRTTHMYELVRDK